PFTQPMPRFDVLPRQPEPGFLNPAPTAKANTTSQLLHPDLVDSYSKTGNPAVDNYGPIEGRPPNEYWDHQDFARFAPRIAVEVTQEGARTNTAYNPGVASQFNSGINPAA